MSFFASLLAEAKTGKATPRAPTPDPTIQPDYLSDPDEEESAKHLTIDELFAAEIGIERAAGGYVQGEDEDEDEDEGCKHEGQGQDSWDENSSISAGSTHGLENKAMIEDLGRWNGVKRGSGEVEVEEADERGGKRMKNGGDDDQGDEELWVELFGKDLEDDEVADDGVEDEGAGEEGWETVTEAGWDSEGWETVTEVGWDSESWETVHGHEE
jgi:hypothetical protein